MPILRTLAITWPPGVLAEVESLSVAAQVYGNVIQQQPAAPIIDINYSDTAFPVGITEHSQQGDECTSAHLPICLAYRITDGTTLRDQLIAMATGNARRTPCERFLGPSILDPNGVPYIGFLSQNERLPRRVQSGEAVKVLAWRWNCTPSAFCSLTLALAKEYPRPHTRWLGSSKQVVTAAIFRLKRFRFIVISSSGFATDLYEASFPLITDPSDQNMLSLESLWGLSTDHLNEGTLASFPEREVQDDLSRPMISKFVDPEQEQSDFWATMNADGPWSKDANRLDCQRASWGQRAMQQRLSAIAQIENLRLGDEPRTQLLAILDADSQLEESKDAATLRLLIQASPRISALFRAVGDSLASSYEVIHQAGVAIWRDSDAAYRIFEVILLLHSRGLHELQEVILSALTYALIDCEITCQGTERPWLYLNSHQKSLHLRTVAIETGRPKEDYADLWQCCIDISEIVNSGMRIDGSYFPFPLGKLSKLLESVKLDSNYQEAESHVLSLLQEAQAARQWSVPWGALVKFEFGPFEALRVFETDGEFCCYFLDSENRYFHVALNLNQQPPSAESTRLVRGSPETGDLDWNHDAMISIKLIAAAIIRDFLIVEDRSTIFSERRMSHGAGRLKRRNSVIYLPRVKYSSPCLAKANASSPRPRLSSHHVVGHARRVSNPSASQRFLAQRYGFSLPLGFTFVRPHFRGSFDDSSQIKIYRSRSASRMIFTEIKGPTSGTIPKWFEFEQDCARLLRSRNLNVIHQSAERNVDGGVDLYAEGPSGQTYIVQCKCWAAHRHVGPDVIRELEGAIRYADMGSSCESKGVVITTSRFTSGAIEVGRALGYELIDGEAFSALTSTIEEAESLI